MKNRRCHEIPLAQAATAELPEGDCKSQGRLWSRLEAQHAASTTREHAAEATEPLIRICLSCPARTECAEWAETDCYTGVAAATVYINGRRRKPDTVIPRPPRQPKSWSAA